jgi:hypothetical protein
MRLASLGHPHLTYCTNIHAGETWAEIRANLERYVLAVKARLAPERRFGVGLRLSAAAADTLASEAELASLRDFLRSNNLYVFTLTGTSHGEFHGERVKERVYFPDWCGDERLRYTNQLAQILAELLPNEPGLEGSISTVPGALRSRVDGDDGAIDMARRMLKHVALLHHLYEKTGKTIVMALEPEPGCYLESTADVVRFFERCLVSRDALLFLAALTGLEPSRAETVIRRHLGVCFDACHMSLAYEEPRSALYTLLGAGLRVAKVQISAGLRVAFDARRSAQLRALEPFEEDTYLHQVVEKRGDTLIRYPDLPQAMAAAQNSPASDAPSEWRVHFRVPIFCRSLGPVRNTQVDVQKLLDTVREDGIAQHLEVETYTWNVLPPEHRRDDVVEAIAHELQWAMEEMGS